METELSERQKEPLLFISFAEEKAGSNPAKKGLFSVYNGYRNG